MSIMGTRVIRTEDPRLLTAGGVYVDDVRTPELSAAAYLTFVRSPVAHARITGIDASEALSEPGVIAVLTVRDMDDLAPPPPDSGEGPSEAPAPIGGVWSEPLLAVNTVRYVGEPVAVVITDSRYQGEDAANLVSVDYDPLPAVVGPAAAVADETLLFPAAGTNIMATHPVPTDDAPFEACEVVVEQDIINQRVACLPMEGRATAASFADGKLTVWHSSQNAQLCRFIVAGVLGMDPAQIRVIVPDVGGGFGAKVGIDRDAIVVAWAARKTGRALRWAETRSENLVGMTQGRAQLQHAKIGGNRDGRILAYRIDVIQDAGAYGRIGLLLPSLTCLMAPGVYDIPEVQTGFRQAVTNATPISAYRGAGRPEAAAAVERAVDLFAAEIGMDPAEVRRRNFVAPDKFPFQTKTGALYDSGRLRGGAGQGAGGGWLRAAPRGTAAQAGQRRPQAARYRRVLLRRDHRAGPGRRRDRQDRGDGRRRCRRLHREFGAWPGAPHRVGDAGAGRARHPDGSGHGHPRGHRPDPGRRRDLRLAVAAARRLGRAQGRDRGQGRGPAPCRGHARGRRSRRGARHEHRACGRCAATRTPRCPGPRSPVMPAAAA